MDAMEKIIDVMRREAGTRAAESFFVFGEVTKGKNCRAGGFEIDREDLKVDATIKESIAVGDTVLLAELPDSEFIILAKVVDL